MTQSISRSTSERSLVSTARTVRLQRSITRAGMLSGSSSRPRRCAKSVARSRYSVWICRAESSRPFASRTRLDRMRTRFCEICGTSRRR